MQDMILNNPEFVPPTHYIKCDQLVHVHAYMSATRATGACTTPAFGSNHMHSKYFWLARLNKSDSHSSISHSRANFSETVPPVPSRELQKLVNHFILCTPGDTLILLAREVTCYDKITPCLLIFMKASKSLLMTLHAIM